MAGVEGEARVKSPCLEPGCPRFASYRGRCDVHKTEREGQIGRAGKKVYATKRWAMTRRRKLSMNPICEWEGCREIATDVHHKHGVEANPFAFEGLESLCHSHHSMHTRREQLGRTTVDFV